MKLLARLKSNFEGRSGRVKRNTYMENIVELENGQRVYMSAKEIEELKKKAS